MNKYEWGAVPVLIIVFLVSVFLGVKGCEKAVEEVEKQGLKSMLNDVWEGKNEN